MKKTMTTLLACLLLTVTCFTSALALDIDYAALTDAELDELIREATAERSSRKTVHVPVSVNPSPDKYTWYIQDYVGRNAAGFGYTSQRLKYRWLMDAPVDQDTDVLFRTLELLKDPRYLDESSVLRLYETAAYYRARLYMPDDAIEILKDMKRYLRKHPSAYYLSAYHRAMGVILHNANRDLKTILSHQDKAIAAACVSTHPEAKKQPAACLLNKATTLMSERIRQDQVRKLIREAEQIVAQYTEPLDAERYDFVCSAAMFHAMEGNPEAAQAMLDAADAIACASPDSDLAVAEHLIEEVSPICIEMGQMDRAAEAVIKAIEICEKHPEALRYRETVFDAYYFLGRIYAMEEDYVRAEAAFGEAEKRVHDSPYEWTLPLCPEKVREKASCILYGESSDGSDFD